MYRHRLASDNANKIKIELKPRRKKRGRKAPKTRKFIRILFVLFWFFFSLCRREKRIFCWCSCCCFLQRSFSYTYSDYVFIQRICSKGITKLVNEHNLKHSNGFNIHLLSGIFFGLHKGIFRFHFRFVRGRGIYLTMLYIYRREIINW